MRVIRERKGAIGLLALAATVVVGAWVAATREPASGAATAESRLVSVREFPALEACAWETPAMGFESTALLEPEPVLPREVASRLMAPGGATSFLMA